MSWRGLPSRTPRIGGVGPFGPQKGTPSAMSTHLASPQAPQCRSHAASPLSCPRRSGAARCAQAESRAIPHAHRHQGASRTSAVAEQPPTLTGHRARASGSRARIAQPGENSSPHRAGASRHSAAASRIRDGASRPWPAACRRCLLLSRRPEKSSRIREDFSGIGDAQEVIDFTSDSPADPWISSTKERRMAC